ncbi:hypothetical protein ACF0H5_017062 [Mactra antiquata]
MAFRMERISEVSEQDNLDILREKTNEIRKPERVIRNDKPKLPKVSEHVSSIERNGFNATRRHSGPVPSADKVSKVRKTSSTPDVLNGVAFPKFNVRGQSVTPENTPREKGYDPFRLTGTGNNQNGAEDAGDSFDRRADAVKRTSFSIRKTKNLSKSLEDISERRVVRAQTDSGFKPSKDARGTNNGMRHSSSYQDLHMGLVYCSSVI